MRRLAAAFQNGSNWRAISDLAFGDFQRTIPAGEYGAGTIEIWDRGEYMEIAWSEDSVTVMLKGGIVTGRFRLIRFPRGGNRAWLMFKTTE